MRRKRRTKYIWLPCLGAEPGSGGDLSQSNGFPFLASTSNTDVNTPGTMAIFPVLEDTPQEQVTNTAADANIADFIGTDYVIKRIVGKVHLAINRINADTPHTQAVTAGFFVARADDQNALLAIGGTTQPLAQQNYDPNYVDNIREPWIWRRTWMLSNNLSSNADAGEASFNQWPATNAGYGSIQDGPHIDAKTGRRVRNDERLWFAVSTRTFSSTNAALAPFPNQAGVVTGYLDIRVLGALRRARNRSNF